MKQKLKDWYTRPRKGYLFQLSAWILNEPSALGIVFFMGLSISTILFLGLSVLFLYKGWLIGSMIIGVFGLASLYKLFKLWQVSRKTGIMNVFDTFNMQDIVGGNKNGITGKSIKKCNGKPEESNEHKCPGNGKKPG